MQRLSAWGIMVALVLALCAPMLLGHSGMAQDWVNHLWYVWRDGQYIGRDHAPSLFLHDGLGVFYPMFAFYGGTLYGLAGTISWLLGGRPVVAYVSFYCGAALTGLGGCYWLARQARVSPLLAV